MCLSDFPIFVVLSSISSPVFAFSPYFLSSFAYISLLFYSKPDIHTSSFYFLVKEIALLQLTRLVMAQVAPNSSRHRSVRRPTSETVSSRRGRSGRRATTTAASATAREPALCSPRPTAAASALTAVWRRSRGASRTPPEPTAE